MTTDQRPPAASDPAGARTRDFLLPDLGEGLTEGEIVSWLVAVGDTVEIDQPVAEMETAKAVVEVPSPFAGTVTALHGDPGDEVEVGAPLLTIDLDGASPAAETAPAEVSQAAVEPAGIPGQAAQDAQVGEGVPSSTDQVESASTLGRDADLDDGSADDDGGSGNVLVGYGTAGSAKSRRRRSAGPGGSRGPAAGAPPSRPLAKPPVRKLARDLGVDLSAVAGSGPDGIITREDVRAHADDDGDTAAARPAAPSATPAGSDYGTGTPRSESEPGVSVTTPDHQPLRSAPPNERADLTERRAVRGMRKAIAKQMTVSRNEIPEATTWVDADATDLWKLRQELNASQDRVKVSPLALIMRACVAGLREFPEVNATLDTSANEIVIQHFVNLGFAAQTDAGLMVPVIQRADQRSVLGLAEELNRLATAARERKVSPEELGGGTFTVSNYGSFGVDGGAAVINHPEAAILGVGRITDRPWIHKGKIKPRKVLQLSIAFDHRICDGGEAAGFLRFVADCVESPTTMLANL
jgi:2-oxoisovalerate dehydrogenase E2 component (dihydrolipoyl transacylase)